MFQTWLFQIAMFLFVLTVIAIPFGEYIAKVFAGERTFLSPVFVPVERFLYKIFGVDPHEDMDWKTFTVNLLLFNLVGLVALFLLQEVQGFLPLNPEKLKAVRWDTAINVAISFVTNTDWQSYKSETTMSYLTQMLGLGLQNFLSAATGMAAAVAFINAFIRKNTVGIGNFWVYLTRSLIYILLPLAIAVALVLIAQGCVDNFQPYVHVQTLEGKEQIIAQGPAASQIAIKHLGTSGGGFFTANSAHPYENPTPFTDYLELLSLLIIAAAFPFAFGAFVNNRAQGWAIFIAMMLLFIMGLSFALWSEFHGNPLLTKLGVHHGLNMEGKEERFGTLASVIFASASTATSTGAMNASLDSLMPLTGLITFFNIAIGGVVFGGVGCGFIGMLFYGILAMFLIGLMIGRTPEIYGKKLEPYEMIVTVIVLFLPCIFQLILSAIAATTSIGIASLGNPSPHGLSEIIYTYASSVSNNGSAFMGLESNIPFYNLTTGFAMLFGRFIAIVCALAIAGSMVQKKINAPTARFPTASPLFVFVLVSVVLIIGALTFFPVLVLGPVLEHLYILDGQTF
ncbi:K(+) transporting P-type ATPase subunit KdpA [Gammaproteobacteria bacterium]